MKFLSASAVFAVMGLVTANAWAVTPLAREDIQAWQIATASCQQQQPSALRITEPPELRALQRPAYFGGMAVLYLCLHKSKVTAFGFARQGAQLRDPLSEYLLGSLYLSGIPGVPANPVSALHWHLQSARQGFPFGEFMAGIDYLHGTGTAPNPQMAAFWIRCAADQGFVLAMAAMGELYVKGIGVPPSEAHARHWMKLAAARGNVPARQWLARHPAPAQVAAAASPSNPSPNPSAQPASPPVPAARPAAVTTVADNQQTLQNLQRFWTLYFQASNAQVVDFGEPALVRPVGYGTPP